MSRMSLGNFLSTAKQRLKQSIQSKGKQSASFVIGNVSADLDSITCALVYGYIQSNTPDARKKDNHIIPIANIPSSELRLRPELKALLTHVQLKSSDLITLDDLKDIQSQLPPEKTEWTVVDHNVLQGELGDRYGDGVNGVIDHHDDEGKVPKDAEPRVIEKTGSCCSHVVEHCQNSWDEISNSTPDPEIDAQLAKLALGPILIDTVNLKATDKVTDHDKNAIKYLESKISESIEIGSSWDRDAFFDEINDAKSNLDDLSLDEILRKDYKQWPESEMNLGISSVVRSISYIKSKSESGYLVSELIEYAKGREDQLFAVMTAHNENGQFERQLLLMALGDGEVKKVAEKFAEDNKEELQLEDSKELDGSKAVWLKLWEQKNLSASRKKVAPMIREAMK